MIKYYIDSDSDANLEHCKKYGLEMISMPYIVDDKEIYPYKDFKTFDPKPFYDMLRSGVLPTTCAINEQNYIDYFEPEFKAGNDIFYIHFSRAMTASFDSMDVAVNKLKEKYPERKFYAVDAKSITIGVLWLIETIMNLRDKGMEPEELQKEGQYLADHYAMYFFADDLKFFKRSGRVGGIAATMGSIIGLKPIIYMSPEGKMESVGKEVGRLKALNRIVRYCEELGDDIKNYPFIIGHSDALDLAHEVERMLKEKFGDDLKCEIVPVNPTAGSHCGPDCVGICFHAIHK